MIILVIDSSCSGVCLPFESGKTNGSPTVMQSFPVGLKTLNTVLNLSVPVIPMGTSGTFILSASCESIPDVPVVKGRLGAR